ncbi:MAG TPA: hypothetical protein VNX68_08100 [Nitrosopumilaceae archaeon]|jgi:hypothetical protein|nr:hypothetical protein [Nitrosopumilaceae archaeon]
MKRLSILLFLSGSLGWAVSPDQSFQYRFTTRVGELTDGITVYNGATRSIPINNSNLGCIGWQLNYNSEGFSAVSINLQTNTKTWLGGLSFGPGNVWSTFAGTASVGSLPITSTSQGNYVGYGYYPYIAINLATATGTGSIDVVLSCWKSINYASITGSNSAPTSNNLADAINCPISSGDPIHYLCTPVKPPLTYQLGELFLFKPDITNSTTTPDININSLGAKVIVHSDSSALAASELDITKNCLAFYDGTNIVLINGQCLTGPGTITLLSNTSLGTPTSGKGNLGFNGTNKALEVKAPDGTDSSTIIDHDCGSQFAQKFLAGAITCGGGTAISPVTWLFGPMDTLGSNGVGTITGNNKVIYFAFSVPFPGWTISKVKTYIKVGAGNMSVGFFDSTCTVVTNGKSGVLAAPGNAISVFTFSPSVSLTSGIYFLALTSDSGTDDIYRAGPSAYVSGIANSGLSSPNLNIFSGANTSSVGVLPGTCGAQTTLTSSAGNGAPNIWIQ